MLLCGRTPLLHTYVLGLYSNYEFSIEYINYRYFVRKNNLSCWSLEPGRHGHS